MFSYIFERAIKDEKTFKDVNDAVCNSLKERQMNDIHIQDNVIIGKDSLIKLDFSKRSPLIISPGKEYFIYNESAKTLIYKVEAFYLILFNLIYAGILFLILYFFAQHLIIELVIPSLFFIIITMVDYFQHQAAIDRISRKINEN
ncbi:Uncharacterised protein [Chryseobacterium nakagawai]|uniref:Uncharacterized protein n=1 Tax=Chryseobacterium nakagawai TaxID=1241982 RepID=A0AAD0YLA7_CHRNA|nr:hypothetical protein [Chryseobacterium nakagawai]AZA89903.1 hypothetical protein EG343_04315 [Chryseobacterium nakagawai]VEH21315.1 Uncharacterised protein [Chryseobacterium nakagawai]